MPRTLRPQTGVIPFRRLHGEFEVMLVTSSTRHRWIIPKGYVEDDLGVVESARLEAYEEAGVKGSVHPEPIGSYLHDRQGRPASLVEVYIMEVEEVLPEDDWPESHFRKREWMPFAAARASVLETGLKDLLTRAEELLLTS